MNTEHQLKRKLTGSVRPKSMKLKGKWCKSNDYSQKCCFYWAITWKLLVSDGGDKNVVVGVVYLGVIFLGGGNEQIFGWYSLRSWNSTSYAICWDKFLAFLHQQKFTKLYWTFNCNVSSVKYACILNKKNKTTKMLNKINSIS